jgi:HSP20 family molecular chaperone IbpA
MDSGRTITLRWIYGVPGDISYQLARFRFSRPVPTWQPAINAYRCHDCVRVCVDLAGVERSEIELTIEPKRLTIRGKRDVPEPPETKKRGAVHMLVMEIDYGPFERTIEFREEIEVQKAHAEQQNGMLWIHLLLKS